MSKQTLMQPSSSSWFYAKTATGRGKNHSAVVLVACDVLFLLSPSKLPLQLSAIIATKAAGIAIAVGHLQHHWKAPSLNRLRLKKVIKWITKAHSMDAKADPVMSALGASKIGK